MKVAVVGSGIAGLMTAVRLLNKGAEVFILAPKDQTDTASRAAMGIVSAKGVLLPRSLLFRRRLEGGAWLLRTFIPWLEKALSTKIPVLHGMQEPHWDNEDLNKKKQRIFRRDFAGASAQALIFKGSSSLPSKEALSFCAKNGQLAEGARFFPLDGWFDPRALMAALRLYVENQGAKWIFGSVKKIQCPRLGCASLIMSENGQKIDFDEVVLACGNGAVPLLERSGIRMVGCTERWGTTLQLSHEDAGFSDQGVWKFGRWGIVSSSSVLIGGFDGSNPASLSSCPHASELINRHFALGSKGVWMRGCRVLTGDREPVVGELTLGKHRVFCSFGFYKNGFSLAGITSNLLCKIMFDEVDESLKSLEKLLIPSRFVSHSNIC